MEQKEIYVSSNGKEYKIDDMPRIQIFNIVAKHGKENLSKEGYGKIVERFENIVKNADIPGIINNMEVNQ